MMIENEKTKRISLEDVQRYKVDDFNRLSEELLEIYNEILEPELKSIIYKPKFVIFLKLSEFGDKQYLEIIFSFVCNNDKYTQCHLTSFEEDYCEYFPTSIVSSFIEMAKRLFEGIPVDE